MAERHITDTLREGFSPADVRMILNVLVSRQSQTLRSDTLKADDTTSEEAVPILKPRDSD